MGFFSTKKEFIHSSIHGGGYRSDTIYPFGILGITGEQIVLDYLNRSAHVLRDGEIKTSISSTTDEGFNEIKMECCRLKSQLESIKKNKLLAENYASLSRQFGIALESIANIEEEVKRLEKEKQDKRKEQNGKPNNEGSYFKPRKRNRKNRRKDHNRAV